MTKNQDKHSDNLASNNQHLAIGLSAAGGALLAVLLLTVIASSWFAENETQSVAQLAPPQGNSEVVPQAAEEELTGVEPVSKSPPADSAAPEPSKAEREPEVQANLADSTASASAASEENPKGLEPLDIDPRLTVLRLGSPTWAMAYDEANGRLAIVDDSRGGVAFYNVDDLLAGKTDPVDVLETRGPATALCLKQFGERRVLLVASKLDSSVSCYDAMNMELIKQVPVESTYYVGFLTASKDPTDPYVLYSLYGRYNNLEMDPQTNTCGRIDLRTMQLDPDFVVKDSHRFERIPNAAISDDGTVVYYSGIEIGGNIKYWRENTEKKPNISYVKKKPYGISKYTVDPHNKFVATGPHILPFALGGVSRHLEFEAKAFFRDSPYIIGVHEQDLVIGSTNGFRKLASISLPAEFMIPSDPERWRIDSWGGQDFRLRRIHCYSNDVEFLDAVTDEQRKLGIVVLHKALVLVALEKFELPDEPQLAVKSNPETVQFVDQSLAMPLESFTQGTKFELASFTGKDNPPVIKGNMLRWTPSASQVGFHHIGLRASKGGVNYEWEWPLEVRRKNVEIPFPVTGISIDPTDRKRAVVWGYTNEWDARNKPINYQWSIGIVDLKSQKLLAHRSLAAPITKAAISSQHAYVIESPEFDERNRRSRPGNKLLQLNFPDLEIQNEISLPAPATDCRVIAGRYLAVSSSRPANSNRVARYSIPKLEELEPLSTNNTNFVNIRRVRDGWLWDGYHWDEQLLKPRLLLSPAIAYAPTSRNRNFDPIPSTPFDLSGSIKYDGYAKIAYGSEDAWRNRRKTKEMLLSLSLYPGRQGFRHSTSSIGRNDLLELTKESMIAVYGKELFVIPLSEFPIDKIARPEFRIEPMQSDFLLSIAKVTRVKYQAAGAKTYSLALHVAPNYNASAIQTSDDGEFSISLREMSSGLLNQAVRSIAGSSSSSTRRSGKGEERLDEYLERTRTQYKPIHPRKFKGVPVLVYATVKANDGTGEEAVLNHCYLTEVPLPLVRDIFRKERRNVRR